MKPPGYLSALAAAGALGAAVILACSNPAVPPPPEPAAPKPPGPTPPQGALTLVYGTNNRIEVTKGRHLMVPPTLTPRAAKVKYSAEGAPDWLNIHPTLGVISASARRIQGAFSSADPSGVRQDFSFRILAAGTKGAYAKQSVTANLVLTVNLVSLPAGIYPARTVSRAAGTAARTITAPLTGDLTAADADFAFDAATPRPAWLTLSDTGTISGVVPANADTAAYKINVTGKGSYAGAADQAEFVLTVNSVPLPGMSYAAKSVWRLRNDAARRIWVGLSGGLPASQADYAFEPPSSKPAWLSVGDTGIISGTVPTNGIGTTYTVKVTGKGIYTGETQNVTFTLNVTGGDFDTLRAAGNGCPHGIWSDGTTMWVDDCEDDKIYAYNMTTKARDSGKDFDTTTFSAAGNNDSRSIWSDGITMWVADNVDDKIYAYNMATKDRDSSKEFNTTTLNAAGNNNPNGLWSDGTTMWVSDMDDRKIYAYNMATKARDSSKDFNTTTLATAGNTKPAGLWSDGTTMWVMNWIAGSGWDWWNGDVKIYAYNLMSKTHDSSKDFNTLNAAGNRATQSIWSDGTIMWVADWQDDKIYAYSMSTKARTP